MIIFDIFILGLSILYFKICVVIFVFFFILFKIKIIGIFKNFVICVELLLFKELFILLYSFIIFLIIEIFL